MTFGMRGRSGEYSAFFVKIDLKVIKQDFDVYRFDIDLLTNTFTFQFNHITD